MNNTSKIEPVTRVPARAYDESQAMNVGVSASGLIVKKITIISQIRTS